MCQNKYIQDYLTYAQLTLKDVDTLRGCSIEQLHDPTLLTDSLTFIEHLHSVKSLPIAIVPDYDPDGICSGYLLYYLLSQLGFQVFLYYPRTQTGFGLSKEAVEEIYRSHPETQVLMTTDNGIMAHEGVDTAKALGWQVLISDHHLQQAKLPDADVIVNPNRVDDSYPYKSICGTTVIWKLLLLYTQTFEPEAETLVWDLIPYVALATVADVMGVLDENRYLIKQGLSLLQDPDWLNRHLPMKALLDLLEDKNKLYQGIDEDTLGFYIAPMLNAPRRMSGESRLGFLWITASSYEDAYRYAEQLFQINEERKAIVKELLSRVPSRPSIKGRVVTLDAGGGFAGLVAGRLETQEGGPVIALCLNDGPVLSGSARSPFWYSMIDGLDRIHEKHPEYFHHYGGHHQAAGVGIYKKHLEAFRQAFREDVLPFYLKALELTQDQRLFVIDGEDGFDLDALGNFIHFITSLKPFGVDFPKPQPYFKVDLSKFAFRTMGKEGQHYKWEREGLELIQWNGERVPQGVQCFKGHFGFNTFRGVTKVQFIIQGVVSC